ncbi:MAG TPA: hypothetical protein VFU28_05295 [Vicinamibacterales bacterium]|nr:hypothetical protein [Vicinamibacterales bacterium]
MSQTKAELDYKISQLQRKAKDMTPRSVVSRVMPERALDYALGSVLTVVGARMAWGRYRARRNRRDRLRTSLQTSSSW